VELALNLPVAHPGVTPARLRELAQLAEELGFVELYLGEHVVLFDRPADASPSSEEGEALFDATAPLPDPLLTHAFVAAATSRIRLATGVLLLPQRNPVYTAKHLATLDWLCGGRLDVGIGVGWSREEYAACGVPWQERGARCDEWIDVMHALWTEPVSRHAGRLYTLAPCRQYPKPVQRPHPPLWIGGWSAAALERAARVGDGWYGFDLAPDRVAACARELERRCEAHGRSFATLTLACGAWRRMPRTRADLAPYAAAGVRHFALSLTSADPAGMPEELRRLARTFGAPR